MKRKVFFQLALVAATAFGAAAQTVTVIPASYAMPAGSVGTNQPGFMVRPYQTTAAPVATLAGTEDQLAGLDGPNLADLSGADTNGYYTNSTVVNWSSTVGGSVDGFAPADAFPGNVSGNYYSMEVLTYVQFPAAGTYTMGVNSDDGFSLATAQLNPKSAPSALIVGQYNTTRGPGDTLFSVSVSQAGIYPFRLVYWNYTGGAGLSWFNVITNSTSTNYVLINDTSTPGALNAYAVAKIAPPYISSFLHSPAGLNFTITDDKSALAPATLQVKLNGTTIAVTTSKPSGTNVTTVTYTPPALFPAGVTNTLAVQYSDNASPANPVSATITFIEPPYTAIPAAAALPSTAVDTTKRGFLYRTHQIDSGAYGTLAANVAHAEAQLAGLLIDPASGTPYPSTATAGEQPDGSYAINNGVVNFSYDLTQEQGVFNTANGHPDAALPGLTGSDSGNIASEIVAYLDLKPGYYQFAVNCTEGFRVTVGANPYEAFGTPLALFDYRGNSTEFPFGVAVQTAGIYPIRLVWFRIAKPSNNVGDAGLEFYTINQDGSRVLVNDPTNSTAVKAYWKRTASYGTFVKYAGPSAFVSPFVDSADVGFATASVIISDGTTAKVDASSVSLTVDGKAVTTTPSYANGLTTLSYTPSGLQLPRTIHSARLVYHEPGTGGAAHTNTWAFHLLHNYVLPAPLYFEDFESTAAGPNPTVPDGWVQENFTGHQDAGYDTTDLNSDFYLGWVVVDKSWNISKDFGVSAYVPQVLNGTNFDESTNPLLNNHYIRAESDSRQNGPPGQIQYLTTKSYDLTGKTGIVIAFNSAYEQNQDSLGCLEYTTDNGTNWHPISYWVQGDNDSQAPSDIYRDSLGNIDVVKTLTTSYSDVAMYTDPTSGQLVGGYYGFFIKCPITSALAPYIEGRYNDDGTESKRIEVYRVPLADNQKNVKFRFVQAGTSSWYWAFDNWGVYSVPSVVVPAQAPTLNVSLAGSTLTFTWTPVAGQLYQLQKTSNLVTGTWQNVGSATSAGSATDAVSGPQGFYRLIAL
jgi:hypothetical protein